jgi:hypothetical protein
MAAFFAIRAFTRLLLHHSLPYAMARRGFASTFDTVRRIGLTLPEVEEGTMYGTPALKLRGKLLACMTSHKSAEPNSLAVRLGFDQRDAMIADDPATYYLKPHYIGYPVVLVRLSRIGRDALSDLLHAAWREVNASAPRRQPKAPARKARR